MMPRVIPCLLLRDRGLVKTVQFGSDTYIGDPVNAVRIFNDKEVDELIFLDIDATREDRGPDLEILYEIAGESFMPVAYGGGISTFEDAQRVIRAGVEKVVINSAAYRSMDVIREVSAVYGAQAVVGAIDAKKTFLGSHKLYSRSGVREEKVKLADHVAALVEAGVGEIFVNSIDRDGCMNGYDLELIRKVASVTPTPVIACGGAGTAVDLVEAVEKGGASAVAAGSIFVFRGKHKAVLINYPKDIFPDV
ncbi:MAG TPA: AglZ/HisF2 family acetamidino modification protein [Sphingopyxis sp.]|jgi:cyclase|uniref:AglZ/HisF2 family acetamidino modification protein n=1 Tax=Sphingopyxis sp. TaxID=1908224 RepID=UPI002E308781|nr:AglZ/HisF2 family acetamidino modification protein [Sphingopyxis sp.]HEX2812381.1 AglZ/HisF2 family acetamidino modification protein [Sphingopyxis sp.]